MLNFSVESWYKTIKCHYRANCENVINLLNLTAKFVCVASFINSSVVLMLFSCSVDFVF